MITLITTRPHPNVATRSSKDYWKGYTPRELPSVISSRKEPGVITYRTAEHMHALLSGDFGRQKPLARPSELYPRRGQEAIYSENGIIERVRIEGVDCTGWGVTVTLSTIPSHGLITPKEHTVVGINFTVACRWENFYTGRADWTCSAQGLWWQLVFDPQLIQEVVQLGASLHDRGANGFERLPVLRKALSQSRIRGLESEGNSTSRS